MARRDRTIYRDADDQKIGGVCSGLARYFDLDPLLVRVAFVAGLVFSGATLIAYLLLWWLVDPAPAGTWDEDAAATASPASGESAGDTFAPPHATDEAASRSGHVVTPDANEAPSVAEYRGRFVG